jgi:hypothetical protein
MQGGSANYKNDRFSMLVFAKDGISLEADLEDINQLLDRRRSPGTREDANVRFVGVTGGLDHRPRLFA